MLFLKVCRVVERLQLRQLVSVDGEEGVELLIQVRRDRPTVSFLLLMLLGRDNSSPIEVLVDLIGLLLQLVKLVGGITLHILYLVVGLLLGLADILLLLPHRRPDV